jgi:hypothetical protein
MECIAGPKWRAFFSPGLPTVAASAAGLKPKTRMRIPQENSRPIHRKITGDAECIILMFPNACRYLQNTCNLVKNAIWQKGRDQQGEPQIKQGRGPATYIGGAAWEAGKGEQQPGKRLPTAKEGSGRETQGEGGRGCGGLQGGEQAQKQNPKPGPSTIWQALCNRLQEQWIST